MSVDLEIAQTYRQQAEELRLVAADPAYAHISATLRKIATEYEQLAERLEAVDKTNKAMARRLEN
jgi:hypothetical protein